MFEDEFYHSEQGTSEPKKEIDWEQRRYEIAKAIIANKSTNSANGWDYLAEQSLLGANALIEKLKK